MPSQLYNNDAISFVAAKPFTYKGTPYEMGDDFPQEEANNIETMVRSRFLIPVIEDDALRPRHWHGHIRTRAEAEEYLNRDRIQLVMPQEPDSDEVVDIPTLTDPNREDAPAEKTEEVTEAAETSAEAVHSDEFDPTYHTVIEVNEYLATASPEERERVLGIEEAGRGRKGILEA